MKKMWKTISIGSIFIIIAIVLGILFQPDIAFVFAGAGIVIIGLAILSYINKPR